jgi:GDP-L-fucose synthase
MKQGDRIYVAGHTGLVGSGLVRRLSGAGYQNLLLPSRSELDLEDQAAVYRFFDRSRPDAVFLAAARVGGILANATYPGDFISSNLQIGLNVVTAARRTGVRKLLNLGSSCIYPREAPQPMREEYLLTGPLEPTNQAYAVAKIAILELCAASNRQWGTRFLTAMPTNLYGPGDNFDLETSHVVPALIRKFHEAKVSGRPQVVVWGSGRPRREFLHVDDLADACVFLMERDDAPEITNVGVGEDLSIAELASLIGRVVDFEGDIVFDTTKPDGTPRKLLDVGRLSKAGWKARIPFEQGLRSTYAWFVEHVAEGALRA